MNKKNINIPIHSDIQIKIQNFTYIYIHSWKEREKHSNTSKYADAHIVKNVGSNENKENKKKIEREI